ncbi:Peptidoglycan/LPS O-acetylase OafA/YrhL, contains acyltransferase and SGNH-hydrolase domains [Pedococcus dokdonensis]|uniref:Peptidoglycan/LPS O-acetylase OafA/YrhL, contains acyltransferase and SGNH-hydrolase domains n=1 Tax=Pedococcus dokdonensis TaxID=443156 RepID=A0A1H0NXH9_9MICO|nr:acyltransferase [Pedococcus dokdonensis]SDO97135.1 Peptidoglycan/LPS O-acetylase OafA/YrhL, contains acyltransferase and SGNH-hydrolase domains [Pedococcus dokdonensis]
MEKVGVAAAAAGTGAGSGVRLATALGGRGNALNVLRVAFAVLVIVSHSWLLGTGSPGPRYAGLELGSWGVVGFFTISGYLIPRARLRTDLLTFLVRRGRRIYPAFWVCCAVTAFVATPLAAHLTRAHFSPLAALGYLTRNATTWMVQPSIGPSVDSPVVDLIMVNPSLWTLAFELTCYALAGALLTMDAVRRHRTTVAVALYVVTATTVVTTGGSTRTATWFIALFSAGWIVGTLEDRMVASRATVVAALAVGAVAALGHPVLAAVPLAYAILGSAALLPCRWFTTHDVSYGTYLYGWPIGHVLHAAGAPLVLLLPLSIVFALVAGAVSWIVVERRFTRAPGAPYGEALAVRPPTWWSRPRDRGPGHLPPGPAAPLRRPERSP